MAYAQFFSNLSNCSIVLHKCAYPYFALVISLEILEAFFIIMANMWTHTGAASPPARTATVDPSCPVISWCLRKHWQRAPAWTPALHPGLSPLSGSRSKSLSWTFTCATTWSSSAQVQDSSGATDFMFCSEWTTTRFTVLFLLQFHLDNFVPSCQTGSCLRIRSSWWSVLTDRRSSFASGAVDLSTVRI